MIKRMVSNSRVFALILGCFVCFGQTDSYYMEPGTVNPGEQIDLSIYYKDVSGTLIDSGTVHTTGETVYLAGLSITLFVTSGVLDPANTQILPAGATTTHTLYTHQFTEEASPGFDAIKFGIFFWGTEIDLDPPGNGNLVATLRVKALETAAPQIINFTPDPSFVTSFDDIFGTQSISNGWLSANFNSLQIVDPNAAPPVINSFTATPQIIDVGNSSTLNWNVTNADTVTLDGIEVDPVGSEIVSPTSTKLYALTAQNVNGTSSANVTITVNNPNSPPSIVSFNASPNPITVGDKSTLSWFVEDADEIEITPDLGIGPIPAQGNKEVEPHISTTYTISATNAFGTSNAAVLIEVGTSVRPVINFFSADPPVVNPGDESTLSWEVLNATSVTIDQGIGLVSASGSLKVFPTETTVYRLNAANATGASNLDATITVAAGPIPVIKRFEADPPEINEGITSEIHWEVDPPADELKLYEDGELLLDLNVNLGKTTVKPEKTKTYTLEATNAWGTITKSFTLKVNPVDIQIVEFSVDSPAVFPGESVTVSWDVVNAAKITLTPPPPGGAPEFKGSYEIMVGATTTFILKAELNNQIVEQRLVVQVLHGESPNALYFPRLRAGQGWESVLGVVNMSNENVLGTCRIFEGDSQVQGPMTVDLAPGGTWYLEPDPVTSGEAWAQVDFENHIFAENAGVGGYAILRSLDGEELVALEAVNNRASPLLVPHVAADSSFFTESALLNLSDKVKSFEFDSQQKYDLGDVQPASQLQFDYRQAMGGTVTGPGWGQLQPNSLYAGVAAVEVFGRVGQRQTVGVHLDNDMSQTLYFPHIAADTNQFWTGLALINPQDHTQMIELTAYDNLGNAIPGIDAIEMAAGSKTLLLVDKNRNDLGFGTSWLKVEAESPILGYMLFGSYSPDDRFSGFQSVKRASHNLAFPYVESAFLVGGYTGVAIVNPSDVNATLTLSHVRQDGTLVSSVDDVALRSNEKYLGLVDVIFAGPFQKGDKIMVNATQPVIGFELIGQGTKQLGGLLAIPEWGNQ